MAHGKLAIHGGEPVSTNPWPKWPRGDDSSRSILDDVLVSGVWAISGRSNGMPLQCQLFREEFARFVGRRWCVETDHGTSALVAAFEALGVGPGDEVIVPDLTWVACASTVLQVGARPVLVDVDPETLCLSPDTIEPALTPRTKCILVVHLNCTAADIAGLMHLARARGLFVVEDCAQAHGARWKDGRAVGADGDLAIFSMQNGKTLTAGEGGAVVGDDESLRRRVEAARADGRELRRDVPPKGEMYLDETGPMMGANYCMNEFAAALLRVGLHRLPTETERRHHNAKVLDNLLAEAGYRTILVHPDLAVRSVYEYGIFADEYLFEGIDLRLAMAAVSAELGFPVYSIDAPLHRSVLFRPESKTRFKSIRFGPLPTAYPVADRAYESLFMIHHPVLLAESDRMQEIVMALEKVREHSGSLAAG